MGLLCGICGNDTYEGKPDGKGIWHYRCQYCVDHADPNGPNPCPECGCTAHENICGIIPYEKDTAKAFTEMEHPLRPDIMMFRCLNCSYEWYNPEYEKYLLGKNILSMKVQQ